MSFILEKKKKGNESEVGGSPNSKKSSSSSSRRQLLPTSTSRPTSMIDFETTSYPSFESTPITINESESKKKKQKSREEANSTSNSPITPSASQRLSEIRSRNQSSSTSPTEVNFPSIHSHSHDLDSNSIKSDSSLTNDAGGRHRKHSNPTSSLPSLISNRKPKTSQPSISFNNQTNSSTDSGQVSNTNHRQRVSSTSSRGSVKSTPSTSISTSPSSHKAHKDSNLHSANHTSSLERTLDNDESHSSGGGALESLRALSGNDKSEKGQSSMNGHKGKSKENEVGNTEQVLNGNRKKREELDHRLEDEGSKKVGEEKDNDDRPSSLRNRRKDSSTKSKKSELKPYYLDYNGHQLTYSPRLRLDETYISSSHPNSTLTSTSKNKTQDRESQDVSGIRSSSVSSSSGMLQVSLSVLGESSFLPSIQILPLPPRRLMSTSLSIKPLEIKLKAGDWRVLGGTVGYFVERGSRISSMIQNLL